MIEVRLLHSEAERERAFELRKAAYHNFMPPDKDYRFSDEYDNRALTWLFGAFDTADDRLVSTMRVSLCDIPCASYYPEAKTMTLASQVVEVSRLCIDPNIKAPCATWGILREMVRDAIITCRALIAENIIVTARPEVSPTYKKLFGFRVLGPDRPYPPSKLPISILFLSLADTLVTHRARDAVIRSITPDDIATRRHQLVTFTVDNHVDGDLMPCTAS